MTHPCQLMKRSLLLFWAVWLSVVWLTNLLDAGKALGLLREEWLFASGNYALLCQTTARYGTPAWLNGLLFLGVIGWEGGAALLFWLAWLRFPARTEASRRLRYLAFTTALLLWAAFLLADEVCIAYAVAGTHRQLFIAQLATLLVLELLPDDGSMIEPAGPAGEKEQRR